MRGAPLGLPGLTAVIPNLYATFAEAPAVLQGYLALSDSLDTGALTAAERQIAEIAISAENSCAHCVAAHLTIGDMLKVSPEVVDAIREGRSLPDARLDRLVAFTRAVVREHGRLPASEVEALLSAGYTSCSRSWVTWA